MVEILTATNKTGTIKLTQERVGLLEIIRNHSLKHGDANLAVPVFHLMLTDSTGKLYVVQRGNKPEDPFLYDKTAGGHVKADETPEQSLEREANEEIGVKIIIANQHNYHRLIRETDTTKTAIVRQINFEPWSLSLRQTPNGAWKKRDQATTFAGRYDGQLTFHDGEAIAVMKLNTEELKHQMYARPEQFTYDIGTLLQKYEFFFKQ